jgi:DNA mismatch endonuclease (patch repair protein)
MTSQSQSETKPEVAIRSALHRNGLRFRKHRVPLPELRCRADIVFSPLKTAVFVDGCFWHGCFTHRPLPARNRDWSREKIARTKARDERNDAALRQAGWMVIRVWEHEDPENAARRIAAALERRKTERQSKHYVGLSSRPTQILSVAE